MRIILDKIRYSIQPPPLTKISVRKKLPRKKLNLLLCETHEHCNYLQLVQFNKLELCLGICYKQLIKSSSAWLVKGKGPTANQN